MPHRLSRTCGELIGLLEAKADPKSRDGMARFGIETGSALGVSMPNIRAVGSSTIKDHALAEHLWQSNIHEARILATLIDKPEWVTREQCDRWALGFDSWDVVDQVTGNLFDRTSFASELISDWSTDDEEFVKRAAFSMIAWMAVHRKKDPDESLLIYLPIIEREAHDGRNFVKKAVNWALRQIGKRSVTLHGPALELAQRLAASEDKAERWVGQDAVKELGSHKIKQRLGLG